MEFKKYWLCEFWQLEIFDSAEPSFVESVYSTNEILIRRMKIVLLVECQERFDTITLFVEWQLSFDE
jgi:hypothetical protein